MELTEELKQATTTKQANTEIPSEQANAPAEDTRVEEIAQLKAEIEQLRLQAAAAAVKKNGPVAPLGTGQQEAAREKAIRSVGGLAIWNQMRVEQRSAILGVTDNISDDEISRYFGSKSNAMAAASLAKLNPSKYKALRVVARERGIF